MDVNLLQMLRLVHIVCGAFWVGCAVTLGFFVNPALLNGDAADMRSLHRIMKKGKLGALLPLAVVLAIASGLWLYRIDFPDMQMATLSRRAFDYALGGFLGVVAFIVGVTILLPTGTKLGVLADTIGTGAPSEPQRSELVRLSRKLLIASRANGILTLGAAAFMALARYAR